MQDEDVRQPGDDACQVMQSRTESSLPGAAGAFKGLCRIALVPQRAGTHAAHSRKGHAGIL